MSQIGRIFIFVNFGLAALALGWATTHLGTADNYRKLLEETQTKAKAELDEVQGQLDQMTAQVNQKDQALSDVRTQLSTTEANRDSLIAQLETAQDENASNAAKLTELAAGVAELSTTNENLQGRLTQAMNDRNAETEAKRDALEAQAAAEEAQRGTEAELAAANDQIAELEVALTSVTETASDLEINLAALIDYTGVTMSEVMAVPKIDGAVLGVNNSIAPGLVSINRGTNDSVKRGYTFDVYSGATYKGRVKVVEVQANMCVAEILKTVEGTSITQGDAATTQI